MEHRSHKNWRDIHYPHSEIPPITWWFAPPKHHWCRLLVVQNLNSIWYNARPAYSTNKIFIFIYCVKTNWGKTTFLLTWKRVSFLLLWHLSACLWIPEHFLTSPGPFLSFHQPLYWSLQCASVGWQENL